MVVGELQRINNPQNFIEIPACAGGIGDLETKLFVGIDDEHRSHRQVVERIGVDHAVQIADPLVEIGKYRIVNACFLDLIDITDPTFVTLSRVNA